MPSIPEQGNQQPGSQDQRKRQRLNDKSLEENEGESGEDEDAPEGDTQVNTNPGNFANDRDKASDAGHKGGQR